MLDSFMLTDKETLKIQAISDSLTNDQLLMFFHSKGYKFFHGMLREWISDLTFKLINEPHKIEEVSGLRLTIQTLSNFVDQMDNIYEEIKSERKENEQLGSIEGDKGNERDEGTSGSESSSNPIGREFPIPRWRTKTS